MACKAINIEIGKRGGSSTGIWGPSSAVVKDDDSHGELEIGSDFCMALGRDFGADWLPSQDDHSAN